VGGGKGDEYDQNTLYAVWKCHNETHYFVQLIYSNKHFFNYIYSDNVLKTSNTDERQRSK
jgi:hypothetical protein